MTSEQPWTLSGPLFHLQNWGAHPHGGCDGGVTSFGAQSRSSGTFSPLAGRSHVEEEALTRGSYRRVKKNRI